MCALNNYVVEPRRNHKCMKTNWQIRIQGPSGERVERLDLAKSNLVIGRSAQADIVISSPEISRQHVCLQIEGERIRLVDQGSKNGIYVDEQRIASGQTHEWQIGQVVRLGLAPERLHLERGEGLVSKTSANLNVNHSRMREAAEFKWQKQSLSEEITRLSVARDQLQQEVGKELGVLEGRREVLQKESRDLFEKAKRQAELILQEAERRSKNIQDKAEAEITDIKKTAELDLADMRLAQTSAIKAHQEEQEFQWQKKQNQAVAVFLKEVREKCEKLIYGSEIDASLKLKLLTAIEECLFVHFVDKLEQQSQQIDAKLENKVGQNMVPNLNWLWRYGLIGASVAGLFVVVMLTLDRSQTQKVVESSPLVPPPPSVEYVVAPEPAQAKNEPVKIEQAKEENVSDETEDSSKPKLVESSLAEVKPQINTASRQPSAQVPPAVKLPEKQQAKLPTSTVKVQVPAKLVSWGQVMQSNYYPDWQKQLGRYLAESQKLDRQKVLAYQQLELKYRRLINARDQRRPASQQERQRLENQFVQEASKLMGSDSWGRINDFRNYYWSKIR